MANESNMAQELVGRTLTQPSDTHQESYNQVSIIKGLSTINQIARIELMLLGYKESAFTGVWTASRPPIMNSEGIGNFISVLESMNIVNFSNMNEKDIKKLASDFFADNYPVFTTYYDKFDLKPSDFNVLKTILKYWALAILSNAKNAGHRNVVRGTVSEGILARAFGGGGEDSSKRGNFITRMFSRGDKR